jgi:hypothetical protein
VAVTRITVTRTEQSENVTQALRLLRDARDRLNYAKAVMETTIDGTDYSALETLFGVPGGQGETYYNLLAGTVGDLNGYNTTATIAQVG